MIEKCEIFSTIDGSLKTNIKQKTPIIRYVSGNTMYYLDNKGVKIPLSENFSARVPLVLGENISSAINEITGLIVFISQDDFLKKEITGIRKSKVNEYVLDVRSGDYKIHFGKYEDVNLKFKKLKAFYNKSLKDKSINQYKIINVKYHNQVVCTKQNQDGKQ